MPILAVRVDVGRSPTKQPAQEALLLVTASLVCSSCRSGLIARHHREAAGPADLLGCGQSDLQEAEGLQLAGTFQGAGVDGPKAFNTTLGGTLSAGNVGANLGVNLSRQGFPLRFGVLDPEKVKDVLARCENRAEAVTVEAAGAWADVVFLTVPASAAVQAVRALGDMKGKVLVDCTNAVGWNEGPVLTPAPEGPRLALRLRVP